MNRERLILEELRSAHPRMLKEKVLWSEIRIDSDGLSLTDLRTVCATLEEKGQIIIVTSDDTTRLKITADGIARLAE